MFLQAFSRYDHHLLLIRRESVRVWEDDYWREVLFPSVNGLASSMSSEPSVSARLVDTSTRRTVRVGSIRWTDQASWAWKKEGHAFVDVQILLPKADHGTRYFPSIYFHIQRMVGGETSATAYDQFIHMAVRRSFSKKNQDLVEQVLRGLTRREELIGSYQSESTIWNIDELESTVALSFIYRGILLDNLPDLARTPRSWTKSS